MTALTEPIAGLAKVTKPTSGGLKKLGVTTVGDLLFYFPTRYLDFSVFTKIAEIQAGETVTIRGVVKTIAGRYSFHGRMSLSEGIISDDSGSIKVVWFNQPWVAKTLKQGDEVFLAGKPEVYKNVLQLPNPIYEPVSNDATHTGRLVPVYRLTEGLYNKTLQRLVKTYLTLADEVTDPVPEFLKTKFGLLALTDAIKELHFPSSEPLLKQAQERIIFDEVLVQQLAVALHKKQLAELPAPSIKPDINLIKELLSTLPFELTADQKRSLWEILQDLETKHPMNRLLQGDVGSGKTMVAFLAACQAMSQSFQVAFLAPTEILAKQHYESFIKTFGQSYWPALQTAHFHISDEPITAKKLLQQLGQGKIQIAFGTHALLSEAVEFKKLGLVVIDEQHRFGVEQRANLLTKKDKTGGVPHLLSMSATPIPRTLALSVYGDLSISTLKHLPSGRKKIATKIIAENRRGDIYDFIKKEITNGRQAFVITPLVEESEKLDAKSVKLEFERLQKTIFPDYKLGMIYGGMKGAEKDKAMNTFAQNSTNILVATSVVEIGVDIPNASVIVIEGAERFGLAQLHQLRGRVGRGDQQSYCFLFTESNDEKTLARLESFSATTDGFVLAETDLAQRGFGSLFGNQQTGFSFKFSRYLSLQILKLGKLAAETLLAKDPDLAHSTELKAQVQPLIGKIHLE